MADNLLSTSISALTTEIINSISTANVEELLNLARSAAALGQTENTSIETAINTRVNQLISSATPDEIKKLSDAIKKVRNETQVETQIGNTDNLSEGLTNLYYKDLRVETYLDSGLSTPSFATASIANISYPTADGTNRQVIMTDGSGTLSFENLDTIHTEVTNQTGSTILKGTPVYQTGTSGSTMTVAPADASSSATMPAVGVLEQDLVSGATGFVIHLGQISGVDTSAFNEGDTIYVAVGGGYTNVPPTGENNLLQNLGRVTKVHASNGAGVVMGAGRTNAVPNLNDGNIFIGDSNNQATTASLNTSVQNYLSNVSGHIIPDTNVTYDLGSAEKKFRDLYLSSGTLYLGDTSISVDEVSGGVILPPGSQLDGQTIPTEISQLSDVNLTVQPEVLEIQVDSPDSGGGMQWLWTWVQTQLPFARTNITNELQLSVPIYTQGTYLINNYASSLHGSMTQTHNFFLKWIEGAGTANNISWVTYGSSTESHPDIDGGNSHTVQTLTVNVPQTITLPTLTAPNVSYTVTNNGSGAYTFSGSAHGDNPEIGPFYRGGTYTININATGHPFYFTTDNGTGFVSGSYVGEWTSGVTGSRTESGTITFTVPSNAPDELYYQCGNHGAMRGNIRVKDLAVETNENGNYIIYGQHDQDGHVQKMEIRPNPELTSQMCIVYDSTTQKFVPQDLATYVENTPSFKNKIKEVAGTATLVAPDGTSLVASVEIYTDASYLPLVGNTSGDIAFAQDTKKLYVWNGTSWEASGLQTSNIDITDISDTTNITEKTVSLTHEGVLTPYVGTSRWYAPKDITINKIIARVDVAPTDADLVIQINKTSSGVTTNQQMTISAGTFKTVDLTPNLTLLEDDYLTLDIVSVGTTVAGENLRVSFNYK